MNCYQSVDYNPEDFKTSSLLERRISNDFYFHGVSDGLRCVCLRELLKLAQKFFARNLEGQSKCGRTPTAI